LRYYFPINSWLPKAWIGARRAVRRYRPAAIMTSGPPHGVHAVGLWLRRWSGLPLVADFRDPWISLNGYVDPKALPSRIASHYERAVMREADAIIINAPRSMAALAEAFPGAAGRMSVITNGYDPETFPEAAPEGPSDTLRVVHPGQFYGNRHPGTFLDAVRMFEQDRPEGAPRLRVKFVGNTDVSFDIQSEIDRRGLGEAVHLIGHVPYAESLRLMSRSDILLLVDEAGRRRGVPAKLYEYLGAGRPVLALTEADSDTAWVLRESEFPHRLAPPSDPAAIRRALAELAAEARAGAAPIAASGGRLAFTRERLTGRLATLLDDLDESRTRRADASRSVPSPALGDADEL
jgi:glycosyltransferase involved in cell wall biosynthesis